MSNARSGFTDDMGNLLRGLCMGAADIVPGVSGGTVALILGHYERLVRAIGNIDRRFLHFIRKGEFSAAAQHIDLRFLVGLAAGIGLGIVALASLMHYLLEYHQAATYAVFVGLILGSSHIISRRLTAWRWFHLPLLALGALVAWQICLLSPVQGNLNPLTAFLSATIAICAMILPGISGAFVLLLLGLYHPVTDLIKGLPRLEVTFEGCLVIAAFVAGCLVGLLAFSRILKWLLKYRHDSTMAFLLGLMLGSLYKIWPFQRPLAASVGLPFKERQFEHVWPAESDVSLTLVIALILVAAAVTLLMERLGAGRAVSATEAQSE